MNAEPTPPAPPVEGSPYRASTPPPAFALYSPRQATVAAIFGSPIAGGVLLALNEKRLGRPRNAIWAVLGAVLGCVALIGIGELLPARGGTALSIFGVVAVNRFAQYQRRELDAHLAAGGRRASGWSVAGLTLGVLLGALAIFLPAFVVVDRLAHPRVDFGADQHVVYESGATDGDARRVGDYLVQSGFFDGSGAKDVRVRRQEAGFAVGFVVHDGVWTDTKYLATFSRMRKELAMSPLQGHPVTVELLDDEYAVKKALGGTSAQRVDFGHEQIIEIEPPATEADARRLGGFFTEIGFFGPDKKGKDIALRKGGGGFVVSVVIGGEADADASRVFDGIRKQVAEAVFPGLPVRLELCDGQFTPKKALGP